VTEQYDVKPEDCTHVMGGKGGKGGSGWVSPTIIRCYDCGTNIALHPITAREEALLRLVRAQNIFVTYPSPVAEAMNPDIEAHRIECQAALAALPEDLRRRLDP
jgi:hypothetical protein